MKTQEEKPHSKYSASGSERWLSCPGSIALCEKAPPSPPSKYAQEGTDAHYCLEQILTGTVETAKLRFRFSSTMVDDAFEAAQYIIRRSDSMKQLLCETKVSLDFVRRGMFGTVDAAIVEEFGTLVVIDFKYGSGIIVDPKDNSQLIYYALGLAHQYNFNFTDVELVIIQPRGVTENGETIRSHKMSMQELLEWMTHFKDGVERCEDPFAPLIAGSHCRFCPAKSICPEISTKALVQAGIDFAPDKVKDAELSAKSLSPENVSSVLKGIEKLEVWIDAVKEYAFQALERGEHVPGYKLVQKRSIRKWLPKAEGILGREFSEDMIYEKKLLSPAQLEKK